MESGPATQADLQALEQRLNTTVHALEQRFEGRLDTMEQRVLDRVGQMIHDSETRLLQAFYGFAEATNKRLNQDEGNIGIFFSRLGTLENRVLEIEKRLQLPPAS